MTATQALIYLAGPIVAALLVILGAELVRPRRGWHRDDTRNLEALIDATRETAVHTTERSTGELIAAARYHAHAYNEVWVELIARDMAHDGWADVEQAANEGGGQS